MEEEELLPFTREYIKNAYTHVMSGMYSLRYLLSPEEALEQLRSAAEAAIAFDNRPEEEKVDGLLLGERTYKRENWDMADSRPLRIILRDKDLAEPEFDTVREKPEFQEIIKMLNE